MPNFRLTLLLSLLLAPLGVRCGAPTMWLQPLVDIDPLALCNDNSSAGYYFVPATTQPDIYLVYLEGGMWCYDQFSCDYRFKNAGYSMSSSNWKDYFQQGGIFEDNPVKSPIAGANKVFVTYCSSDAWVGDAITYGYQFRGARIVDAVLASLVSTKGMGASGPARLLFGGCSAGGRGAAFSLDYVDAALERAGAAPGAVTVYGLLDAALWIDVPPEFDGIVSQQCQTAALAEMVNATRLGDACLAAYPGVESWKCLFGEYRMPFVTTPYIMQASQLDTFQIDININAGGAMLPPTTADQFGFAQRFQTAAKAVLAGLPTAQQPGSAVFSPACFHHCVTDAAGFWNIQIGGRSFRDAFAAWFFNSSAPLHIVDACSGWRCGQCSSKRSLKGGKLKAGHGDDSPAAAAVAAAEAASDAPAGPPPVPGHPDPWGWTPAQAAADAPPPPAICVEAGLVYTPPPAPAPEAAEAAAAAFRSTYTPYRGQLAGAGTGVGAGAPMAGEVAAAAVAASPPPAASLQRGSAARAGAMPRSHSWVALVPIACLPLVAAALWRFPSKSRAARAAEMEEKHALL